MNVAFARLATDVAQWHQQFRELLDAGKQDGSIRLDADPGDFLQLTGALWRAASRAEDRSPRMLALILDGLRTQIRR